jgi:hypothetical protein
VTHNICLLAFLSSEEQLSDQAERSVALVPIRVEFETETHRVRDCFVWNLHESLVTPEEFARTFVADLDLPATPWADTVAAQIRAQLEDQDGVGSMELAVDGGGYGGDEVPECRVILSVRLIFPSPLHFCFDGLTRPRSMCRWTTTTYWIISNGTCALGSHRKSSPTSSASTSDSRARLSPSSRMQSMKSS